MCSISCISAHRSSASDHSRASSGRTMTGRRDAERHRARARLRARAVRRAGKRRARPRGGQVRRGARQPAARYGESSTAATTPTPRERGTAIAPASQTMRSHCDKREAGQRALCGASRSRRSRLERSERSLDRGALRAIGAADATGTSIVIAGTTAIRIGNATQRRERRRDHQMPHRRARRSRERA